MLRNLSFFVGLVAYVAVQAEAHNFQFFHCANEGLETTHFTENKSVKDALNSKQDQDSPKVCTDEKYSYSRECLEGKFTDDTAYGRADLEWTLDEFDSIEKMKPGEFFGELKTEDGDEMKCLRVERQAIKDLPTNLDCRVFATCCDGCWE